MAKKTITVEVCDQCGKDGTTYEMVIGVPGQPAKVYDLCIIDHEALLAITGGVLYNYKKGRAAQDDSEIVEALDGEHTLQQSTEDKAHKRHQVWDKEEIQFLLDNPLMSHVDAALTLNRTFFAVRTRRIKLRAEGHTV